MEISNTQAEYAHLITLLRNKISAARVRTALAINHEVLQLYWDIGAEIVAIEKNAKWGDRIYQKLSTDLNEMFPGSRGYSPSNLKRMRLFAETYPDFQIGARLVHQLPWGHVVVLMHKIKKQEVREWYALQAVENGWSRDRLAQVIGSSLYERQALPTHKTSNFQHKLPPPHAQMAQEMQKNPYNFDFMGLTNNAKEREIEIAGVTDIRKLLMELGKGFAFLGNQVAIEVDGKEYFLDMLFYHVRLHSYIVVELKADAFEPEHAGKLNFYLNAVDNQIKTPEDNPSIGLLLCQGHSKIVAEYSLQTIDKPIGISNYELTKQLPDIMKSNLPSIEEIEEELKHLMIEKDKPNFDYLCEIFNPNSYTPRLGKHNAAYAAALAKHSTPPASLDIKILREATRAFLEGKGLPYPKGLSAQAYQEITIGGMQCYQLKHKNPVTVPTIVMYFAGGFCLESMGAVQAFMANVATHLPCNIILPNYPLAPEVKAPEILAQIDQFLQAFLQHPPSKEVIIMGWSSGGNLALTSYLNVQKNAPELAEKVDQLILIGPWIDLSMQVAQFGPFQKQQNMDRTSIGPEVIAQMARWYLPEGCTGAEAEYCPASRNPDELKNVPPVTIINGDCESTFGDAALITYRLRHAGNSKVQFMVLKGQTHNHMCFEALSRDTPYVPELIGRIIKRESVADFKDLLIY